MRRFGLIVGYLSILVILAACQAARPVRATTQASTPESTRSASPASGVSTRALPSAATSPNVSRQNVICAAVFHGAVQGGQCRATNVRVSAASPSWVYARVGIYNAQGQLASDLDQVVINLTTHEVIGPTNVGFCQPGPGGGGPIGGYGAIPAVVLTSLGLSPCRGASATAGAPPPSSTSATAAGPTSVSAFAATWRAHEMLLAITNAGAGHLTYPDLTACPSCSESTAPAGSLDFMLTSVTNGVAAGRVTASSDVRNWALGLPVRVTLTAGSPGQLLDVKIGGKQLVAFCNGTSAGQCGA
jgi:hypothetical protein